MKKLLTLLWVALLLNTVAIAQLTPCVDAYEPNNTTVQATTASALPYDVVACLGIAPQDQDWFAFSANGQSYLLLCRGFSANTTGAYRLVIAADTIGMNTLTITTTAPTPGLNTDTYLELYDASGTIQLAQNDDSGVGFYSQIIYNAGSGNPGSPINIAPPQMQVTDAAGTTTFTVAAAGSYTFASSDPTWLTLTNTANGSTTSGTGNTTIMATYTANISVQSRAGTATFTDSTGITSYFNLWQQGSTVPTPPCLDANEPNNTQPTHTAIATLPYNDNALCLTASDHDWFGFAFAGINYFVKTRGFFANTAGAYGLTITPSSATDFTITTSDINGTNIDTYLELYDSSGVALLAQNDDYNSTFQSQIIYNTLQPILVVTPQYNTIPDSIGTLTIGVTSNGAWAASNSNANWITITQPGAGTGNGSIIINYAANPLVSNRTGYVNVAGGGQTRSITIVQQGRTGPNACNSDPLEPNNTQATASNLTLPFFNGSLCLNAADEDWFAFSHNGTSYIAKCTISPNATTPITTGAYGINIYTNNSTFTISTYNISGNATPTDTYLELYDSTGTVLLASNDNQTQTSLLSRISYPQAVLTAAPAVRYVQAPAGTVGFVITTTNPTTTYTVVANAPWITIASPTTNTGNTNIVANYPVNTGNTRTGSISVTSGNFVLNINITQYGTNGGGTGGGTPCNDPNEPNNNATTATQISALPYTNTTSCLAAADHDWFAFAHNNTSYLIKCRGFSPSTNGAYILDITPTATGFELTTSAVPNGSNTDTYLELYDSTGVNQLAQNDDFGGTFFSQISYNLQNVYLTVTPAQMVVNSTAGMDSIYITTNITYATNTMSNWITISSTGGTGNGGLAISYAANPNNYIRTGMVRLMGAGMMRSVYITQLGANGGGTPGSGTAPANDEVCNAQAIVADSTCINTTSTNVYASYNISTPPTAANCPTPYSADVWFSTQMPASGTLTVRTTAGSLQDAVMAIYEGNCNNLVPIDCEDDNFGQGGGLMPVITINRPAGTDIFIRIYGFAGQQGTFDICAIDYATPTFAAATPAELASSKAPRTAAIATIKTYPNPLQTGNNLYVTTQNANLNGNDRLKLYDMLGKIILNTNINAVKINDVLKLNTSDMAQGIYYLQIETTEGKIFGEKIRIEW